MMKSLPFLNCAGTATDAEALQDKFFNLFEPNKDGHAMLGGISFAKALSEFLGLTYVNNKAPFDAVALDEDESLGAEFKLNHEDPHSKGRLFMEFKNGTAAPGNLSKLMRSRKRQ